MILATTNAVNLTDGLDGLAAGSASFAFAAYVIIGFWALTHPAYGLDHAFDLAVVAAAMLGGCTGFLWWNAAPARIFMGDTGSLAIGSGLACLAALTATPLLFPIIGGLFIFETVSVILQVGSFRLTGRRIFRMAPVHHHFELVGWPETTVIIRFWILAALCTAAALGLFYADFVGDRPSPSATVSVDLEEAHPIDLHHAPGDAVAAGAPARARPAPRRAPARTCCSSACSPCSHLLGLVMVLSASSVVGLHREGSSWFYFLRQLVGVVGGLVLFLITVRIDYRRWRPLAVAAATLAVLAPARRGARARRRRERQRLVALGRPRGAAAPAVGVRQAGHAAGGRRPGARGRRGSSDAHRVLLPALVWVGLVAVLLMAQPNLGTTLVLGAIVLRGALRRRRARASARPWSVPSAAPWPCLPR